MSKENAANKSHSGLNTRGQILVGVLLILIVLGVMIPAIVFWVQNEAKWTVKEHKSTVAFNLANAGVERGMWKLKGSTATWTAVYNGIVQPGYNFDTTYKDINGGIYRIRFVSGLGNGQVAIIGDGRDWQSKETRAIKTIYQNQSIPGAVISRGMITWANAFSAHWGPIMAHKNVDITDANAAKEYFPRKYSRQVVQAPGNGKYARDTNGIDPPNTDNVEWWSAYPVPDFPILDFEAMRASATATGTLNLYGCKSTGASWDKNSKCPGGKPHTFHFGNPYNHPDARKNYTWYWDGDVELTGDTGDLGSGILGTLIVRGNCTLNVGDNYSFTGKVPPEAWREYQKIDTAAINEYPGDDGLRKCRSTFGFGSQTWTGGPPTGNTDVGIRGFLYVGKDFTIEGPLDICGSVWVEGSVNKNTGVERCVVFFNDALTIPSLNVVLVKKSWEEIPPDATAWQP